MSERLLTTEDAGDRLGVTAARIRAMIAAGRLPAQKFGPVYMILESDLHLVENRKPQRTNSGKRAAGQMQAEEGISSKKKGGKK